MSYDLKVFYKNWIQILRWDCFMFYNEVNLFLIGVNAWCKPQYKREAFRGFNFFFLLFAALSLNHLIHNKWQIITWSVYLASHRQFILTWKGHRGNLWAYSFLEASSIRIDKGKNNLSKLSHFANFVRSTFQQLDNLNSFG